MHTKELYASLQFAEDELRIVVAEDYMSRLNILKTLRLKMDGIVSDEIADPESVSAAIVRGFDEIETSIGYKFKDVIMTIPSDHIRCVKRRINIPIKNENQRIQLSHAQMGIKKVLESFSSEDEEFINIGSVKYTNNGITSRSLPLNEHGDVLTMEVELLLAPKKIVYSYASVIEKSGLNLLDIYIDSYAIAEESAILENSMSQFIVLNNFERYSTVLTLFYKGTMIGSEKINYGYEKFVKAIKREYDLSEVEALKLCKELSIYKISDLNDSVVFMYNQHGMRQNITRKELYNCIKNDLNKWILDVNEMNKPIVESGPTKMVISGSGADIVGIEDLCDEGSFMCPSQIYLPDTIGARKGIFAVSLGAIYAHRKWMELLGTTSCEYEGKVKVKNDDVEEDENAFTTKLKNILLNK